MIVLYSTHCPRCVVLEKKLREKNIEYTEITDTEIMLKKDIISVPVLEIDGKRLQFVEANEWINEQEASE